MVTQRFVLQVVGFPRPEGELHTRSRLPCQRSRSPRMPEGISPSNSGDVGNTVSQPSDCPFPVAAGWNAARNPAACRRVVLPEVAGGVGASLEGGERQNRYSLREPSMAFPASRSRGALPSKQCGPNRGTIQQTKAVRRTPRLQRTLEAFSPSVPCGRWRLRGGSAVCNGRTLKRQALTG